MPGFDGTGPRGEGPFTGRGEGYCVMRLPKQGSNELLSGLVGLQGVPVGGLNRYVPQNPLATSAMMPNMTMWPRPRLGWGVGRCRGRRRRGRW